MGPFGWQVAVALTALSAQGNAAVRDLWREAKSQRLQRERSELSRVAKAALPAVVSITATSDDELSGQPQRALGSGFFIHPDGYILTSYHVVGDAKEIHISVSSVDGGARAYSGTLVGKDELADVALLKIDSDRKFPTLSLGSTESVDVADWVVVIGNPFGMSNSVTVGVVSYKGRTGIAPDGKDGYFDYLQTDASINPGNSGGPVLDLDGNVIAMASAVNVTARGIGFAVPIEIAKEVLPRLGPQDSVRHCWMGIAVKDAAEARDADSEGVVVSNVLHGGPAAQAGVKVGDVIVSLGTESIRRADALWRSVAKGKIGNVMDLTVRRDGEPLHLKVRLAESPVPANEAELGNRISSEHALTRSPKKEQLSASH
jgi:serine protease Do